MQYITSALMLLMLLANAAAWQETQQKINPTDVQKMIENVKQKILSIELQLGEQISNQNPCLDREKLRQLRESLAHTDMLERLIPQAGYSPEELALESTLARAGRNITEFRIGIYEMFMQEHKEEGCPNRAASYLFRDRVPSVFRRI